MNKTDTEIEYLTKAKELKSFISSFSEADLLRLGLLQIYSIITSSIYRFLPPVESKEYFDLVKEIQFNRNLSIIDQSYFFLADNIQLIDEHDCLSKLKRNGFVISTYHTGSYRLIISFLLKERVKFALVTESKFIHEQGGEVKALSDKMMEYLHIDKYEDIEIFSAQDPNLLFKLKNKLAAGYSIVFYIDGNTGTNEFDVNEDKLLKIDFLSDHINVRKGIAYLSFLTKTNVISVICKRTGSTGNQLKFEPVESDFSLKREDFVSQITRRLFSILEDFITENPDQWEGWYYIHKFFKVEKVSKKENKLLAKDIINKELLFNEKSFRLLQLQGNYFLIDYKYYKILGISKKIFEILSFFYESRKAEKHCYFLINNIKVSSALVKELVNQKYLTLS